MSGPWDDYAPGAVPPPVAQQPAQPAVKRPPGPWDDYAPTPSMPLGTAVAGGLQNFVGDAQRIGEGVAEAGKSFVKDPTQLAKGLVGFGKSALAAVPPMETVEADMGAGLPATLRPRDETPEQKAERDKKAAPFREAIDGLVQKYGGWENIKRTFHDHPAEFLLDAMTAGSMGEAAGLRVPGAVGKVAGLPGKAAGKLAQETLGFSTGSGGASVREAVMAGWNKRDEFLKGLAGKYDGRELVDWARKNLFGMRTAASEQYNAEMAATKANRTPLDPVPLLKSWVKNRDITEFEGFPKRKIDEGLDREVMGALNKWYEMGQQNPKLFTPEGFDALKQYMQSIRDALPADQKPARAYVGELVKSIKDQIIEQEPTYAKAMGHYWQAQEAIEEIEATLSLKPGATNDTAMRKLLSAFRTGVNANFGERLKLVEKLEKEGNKEGLMAALAGTQMKDLFPHGITARGLAALNVGSRVAGGPASLAALPFQSPLAVGSSLYAGARSARALSDLKNAIPGGSQLPRAGLVAGQIGNLPQPGADEVVAPAKSLLQGVPQ